jgi:hypothetical protein
MTTITQRFGRNITRLLMLAILVAMVALGPPGSYRTAHAEGGKTVYVDAINGSDGNTGASGNPVRSLKKALSIATAGDIITLAPGLYDKQHSGDTYPETVPGGVTIVGTLQSTGAAASMLSASASPSLETGLIFAGSATVKDIQMNSFDTAIKATTGTVSLTNTDFVLNRISLDLRGSAQTTLIKSDLTLKPALYVIGIRVADTAIFTMVGGKVTASALDCKGGGDSILAFNSAQVIVTGSPRFSEAPGQIIGVAQNAKATANFVSATKTYPSACPASSLFSATDSAQLTLNDSTITGKGDSTSAVAVASNSTVPLTISRTTIRGFIRAAVIVGERVTSMKVEQSGIASNGIGLDAEQAINANILVTDTQFDRNTKGLIGLKIKLRRSKVTNGTIGVTILGNGADLGSFTEQGGNTFTGNTFSGVVLKEQFAASSITLSAVGNTWNPNIQGADGNGRYFVGSELTAKNGEFIGLNVSIIRSDTSSTPMKVIL